MNGIGRVAIHSCSDSKLNNPVDSTLCNHFSTAGSIHECSPLFSQWVILQNWELLPIYLDEAACGSEWESM